MRSERGRVRKPRGNWNFEPLCGSAVKESIVPKMKSHKGAARRVRITGSGKFTSRKGSISHRMTRKSKAALRAGDEMFVVARPTQRVLSVLLPYAKKNRHK